jgi:small nuclear ribonucleoprotein (snRNP)-like protein
MKLRLFIITLTLLALSGNSFSALAKDSPQASRDWSAVRALSLGTKLSVRTKDGKKLDGSLRQVTDTALTIDRDSGSTNVSRDAVEKVYQVLEGSRGKSVAKGAAIGAAIGFGAGAGVGIAAGSYEDLDRGELVAILGGIGAAIGAGIGALAASFGKKEKKVLIYEA